MNIEVGKRYKTQDGNEAYVAAKLPAKFVRDGYRYVGAVVGRGSSTWTADGKGWIKRDNLIEEL